MSFAEKICVITGGGSGIGRALAESLAQAGAKIVIADINIDAAKAIAEKLKGWSYQVDVADEASVLALINSVEADIGPIDMLVSNAGIARGDGPGGAALAPIANWETCWNVNVMGHVYGARHLIPLMLERGHGQLINVASAAGLLSQIGDAAYTATKHAAEDRNYNRAF